MENILSSVFSKKFLGFAFFAPLRLIFYCGLSRRIIYLVSERKPPKIKIILGKFAATNLYV